MKPELIKISELIAKHLEEQRAICVGKDGEEEPNCVYRNGQGQSCAVGGLIDAKHYHSGLEGKAAGSQIVMTAVAESTGIDITRPPLFRDAMMLLQRWQKYHDSDVNRTGNNDNNVYSGWLAGEPNAISPQIFHSQLLIGDL